MCSKSYSFGSSKTKQLIAFRLLLQISIIRLIPPPKTFYIHSLASTNIIVTKLARPDTVITDKTRESSTLKFMVMIV